MLVVTACSKPESQSATQPRLKTTVLQVESARLDTEIADTPESMERGLMFRDSMGEDQGMLFIFPEVRQAAFWMRNTKIPLSVAYLDATGRILEIHDMFPYDETPVESRSPIVAYALEVNQGWFGRKQVQVGKTIQNLPKNLQKTP